MKLLFADDEMGIRMIVSRVLGKAGHHVVLAQDGEHAYALFSRAPDSFDAVVTDVRMPRLDGFGLVRRLRSSGHATPCVLMSGHIDVRRLRAVPLAGIVGVLQKPFHLEALLDVVDRVAPA